MPSETDIKHGREILKILDEKLPEKMATNLKLKKDSTRLPSPGWTRQVKQSDTVLQEAAGRAVDTLVAYPCVRVSKFFRRGPLDPCSTNRQTNRLGHRLLRETVFLKVNVSDGTSKEDTQIEESPSTSSPSTQIVPVHGGRNPMHVSRWRKPHMLHAGGRRHSVVKKDIQNPQARK